MISLELLLSFLASGIITLLFIPNIVKIAKIKRLTDDPDLRKIHGRKVPALGGIAVFAGFLVSVLLFGLDYVKNISLILVCLAYILCTGLKDDLITLNAKKKLICEFIIALIITVFCDIRFTSFHGFLGIYDVPLIVSVLITVFFIIAFINSFNLIDGIDGLAASTAITASMFLGVFLWLANDTGFALMAFALSGALIAFVPFNMSKGRNKIFMGDTGSLVTGLILAIIAIRFNEINITNSEGLSFISAPAILIAVFILPFFDTLRVMTIRISNGRKIFNADCSHIHHRLLRIGLTHSQATLILTANNMFFIVLSTLLDFLGVTILSSILLFLALSFSIISGEIENKYVNARNNKFKEDGLINNVGQKAENKVAI